MMKKILIAGLLAFLAGGCAGTLITSGKYDIAGTGQEDFAAVYNDLIFLRLRNPMEDKIGAAYWDWAGKYELDKDGNVILDMDDEDLRLWKFYYQIVYKQGSIGVLDIAKDSWFYLNRRNVSTMTPNAMYQ